MGGRIGLKRGMVSNIDQIEVFLLQILAMKQLFNGGVAAAATASDGGAKLAVAVCMLRKECLA